MISKTSKGMIAMGCHGMTLDAMECHGMSWNAMG